ncbi:Uncharacterised protein [Bordetella pertussis]|nr:Uncharacterised protein [Bordetella pertussis]
MMAALTEVPVFGVPFRARQTDAARAMKVPPEA